MKGQNASSVKIPRLKLPVGILLVVAVICDSGNCRRLAGCTAGKAAAGNYHGLCFAGDRGCERAVYLYGSLQWHRDGER